MGNQRCSRKPDGIPKPCLIPGAAKAFEHKIKGGFFIKIRQKTQTVYKPLTNCKKPLDFLQNPYYNYNHPKKRQNPVEQGRLFEVNRFSI
ncbi:MAG: hypothetical protein ACOX6U_09780 [Oscillospiraceae bacterium]